MANYNTDEIKERGFWYDVEITRKVLFKLVTLKPLGPYYKDIINVFSIFG